MTPKRIAMVALPVLMEDLVRRACRGDATIEVVEPPVETIHQYLHEHGRREIDVVITAGVGRDTSPTPRAVLSRQPSVRVLMIEEQQGEGVLYELRPQQTTLGPMSLREILRVIREDTGHRDAWAELPDTPRGGTA